MAPFSIVFICSLLLINSHAAVISREDSLHHYHQKWRREAQDGCIFDKRTLVCTNDDCEPFSRLAGVDRLAILLPDGLDIALDNTKNYDIHAFRLCGESKGTDITLEQAMENGENCPLPETFRLPSSTILTRIEFDGCRDLFYPSSNENLEIYAFTSSSACTGPLKYRFLLINTTSKFH